MIKFKVKVRINGTVKYHGRELRHNEIVNEYDTELLQLVEQKLIKVERIEIDEIKQAMKDEKKKKNKDFGIKLPELD